MRLPVMSPYIQGQSNMAFLLEMAMGGPAMVQDANNYPEVRLFTVKKTTSATPLLDLKTPVEESWSVGSNISVSDDGASHVARYTLHAANPCGSSMAVQLAEHPAIFYAKIIHDMLTSALHVRCCVVALLRCCVVVLLRCCFDDAFKLCDGGSRETRWFRCWSRVLR